MADEIPLYPTKTNLSTFKDFVNLQKQMNDHLLMERQLYNEIGHINLDIQARVTQRRQEEFKAMKDIQNSMVKIQEKERELATTHGTRRKELNRQLKSLRNQITAKQDYIKMSQEASNIEMEMTKKAHEENMRGMTFLSQQASKIFGIKVNELQTAHQIGLEARKMFNITNGTAMALGGLLVMLQNAYGRFVAFDKAAWEFRKALGMNRTEAQAIRNTSEKIAVNFMHLGVTIDGAYRSFQALGKAMGGVHNVSAELVENVSLMASQFGISEQTSAGFLRNLAAISNNSMESQQSMMGFAQAMSAAGGVPLGDVMKDVATRSNTTLTMMSRLPNIALKSAIELRRMGTSLDAAARSSRHILDFTESMNEEMEASVLLGRSVNLQRARELAYRRDLEGSTKEILRITKSVNFDKLDPFQQEAFAKATGKTVDELMNMLQTDRQIEKTRRSGTPEAQKQLAIYEKMHAANEAAAKALAKNAEAQFRSKANQERLVAIQNKWNQLLAKANQFLLPVIDKILEGALGLIEWAPQIMMILTPLGKAFDWLSKIVNISEKVAWWFRVGTESGTKWLSPIEKVFFYLGKIKMIGTPIVKAFGMLSNIFGKMGWFFGTIGKFLGPIGWVITAFQAITGFIKGWKSAEGGFFSKLFGGIMGALRNIIPGFGWLVDHLGGVWDWIKKIYHGLTDWFDPIGWIVDAWGWVKDKIKIAFDFWVSAAGVAWGWMKNILGTVWEIGKFIFKWFTPVGLVIEGFKAMLGLLDKVKEKLTGAFSSAWGKVKKIWGGNSPSEAGLSIARGIESVTPILSKALQNPFQAQFDVVKKIMPMIGKAILNSPLGMLFGAGKSLEAKVKAMYFPAVKVSPQGTKLASGVAPKTVGAAEEKESGKPMSEETGQKMVALLEKILAKDTNVHMDGQLLSTSLARQTEFRGGYGVNKVT